MNMTSCLKSLLVLFITYHSSYAEVINCQPQVGKGTCECDSSISKTSCQLKCGGTKNYQCSNDDVICRDGDDCTVTCDGYRQCWEARIKCPNGANCTVQCLSGVDVCGSSFTIDMNNAKSFKCEGNCPSAYSSNPTFSPTIATYSPTKKPTLLPTSRPTISPTKYPTKYPTIPPTKYPTKSPSQTNYPTESPLRATQNPTNHPTENPHKVTQNPTNYPTENALKATQTPSNHPMQNTMPQMSPTDTIVDQAEAIETTISHIDEKDTDTTKNESMFHLIWIGIAIFFTGCIVVTVSLRIYAKRKSKSNIPEGKHENSINDSKQERISNDKVEVEGVETNMQLHVQISMATEMDNNVKEKMSKSEDNIQENVEGIVISPDEGNDEIEEMYTGKQNETQGVDIINYNYNTPDEDASRCVDDIELSDISESKPLPISPVPGEISIDNNDPQVILEKIWKNRPSVIDKKYME